jgi:hypothetical protein
MRNILIQMGCYLAIATIVGCAEPDAPPTIIESKPTEAAVVAVKPVAQPTQTVKPIGAKRTLYTTYIRFGVVEVPTGIASGSEELWSYLDEEPVSKKSKLLGLNGLRVGVGRAEVWGDLKRVLTEMTGQEYISKSLSIPRGKNPAVTLKSKQPMQTIFTYHPDGSLSGRDYPPGDDLLRISPTIDTEKLDRVLFTIIPQILTTKTKLKVEYDGDTPRIAEKPVLISLDHLQFQLWVKQGDFLVIGPGIQARRNSSIGKFFLTQRRNGVLFETVLILQPSIQKHTVRTSKSKPK